MFHHIEPSRREYYFHLTYKQHNFLLQLLYHHIWDLLSTNLSIEVTEFNQDLPQIGIEIAMKYYWHQYFSGVYTHDAQPRGKDIRFGSSKSPPASQPIERSAHLGNLLEMGIRARDAHSIPGDGSPPPRPKLRNRWWYYPQAYQSGAEHTVARTTELLRKLSYLILQAKPSTHRMCAHDHLFHTHGHKVFIVSQMSWIKYIYYINNISKD
jgi:hypothetical protein